MSYLKPFEMTVKLVETRAMMSSFNRIGTRWAGGDFRLLTEILRNEWGFRGTVISDYNENNLYMHPKQMIYAGDDLNLCSAKKQMWNNDLGKPDSESAADVTVLRMAAKNVLYTVANSNAMNGLNYIYKMAIWQIILIVVDVIVFFRLAVWGFFAIRGAFNKKKPENCQTSNNSN